MSGVSWATIGKWESRTNPPKHPERPKVINVARALKWDPDEALALLGYSPMNDDERRFNRPPADAWDELARLWPRLSGSQQQVIVKLVAAILEPQRPVADDHQQRPSAVSPIPRKGRRPKQVLASEEPGRASRHHGHTIGTASEPTRTGDGHNGNDYDPEIIEPS